VDGKGKSKFTSRKSATVPSLSFMDDGDNGHRTVPHFYIEETV